MTEWWAYVGCDESAELNGIAVEMKTMDLKLYYEQITWRPDKGTLYERESPQTVSLM